MTIIWHEPTTFNLSAQQVIVWRIYIPDFVSNAAQDINCLDKEEQVRAKRFKFDRDRESFIVTHAALRKILSQYLLLPPEKIKYKYNQYNKPSLANAFDRDLHFNLSHSRDYALIAITLENDIGVDIEHMRETRDLEHIAKRFFSEEEFKEYLLLSEQQKIEGFYNGWTRKEAFIKAIGKGLYYPLKNFVVTLSPGKDVVLKSAKDVAIESWHIIGFQPAENYCAAIAVSDRNKLFEFYEYNATYFS